MKFAVIFSVLIVFAFAEDVKQEEGVYVLTEKNFDGFVSDNEHVLVEFCEYQYAVSYAPISQLSCQLTTVHEHE
jgi:hypothetical protein